MAWVDTGICSEANGRLQQRLLDNHPTIALVSPRTAVLRSPPRPDWAPPRHLPPQTVTAYVGMATGRDCTTWSVVAVTGGDGTFDETATLQYEAAAPAEDADRQKVSRDVMREIARLHLRAPVGTPLHVRTPAPMVDTIAGLDGAPTYGAIRHSWMTVRAHGEAWLSAATPHTGLPWADRATTLAAMCTEKKRWGDTGPSHAHLPLAAAPDPDTCCICFEDFVDMLPQRRR